MNNIIESLKWRYATKEFDTTKKLTQAQLDTLLEAARLSPSSFGIQPWKFVVVTNPDVRAKLREAAWGQAQITDASALIVFCMRTDVDEAFVEKYMQSIASIRNIPTESLKGFGNTIKGVIKSRTPEALHEWLSRQVYISLGVLVSAAASLDIDACPMEGFDSKKFDEILGLGKLGLESRVLAAVGFRSATDPSAKMAKARFPKGEVVVEVK